MLFKILESWEANGLKVPLSAKEVFFEELELNGDKVPSLDGFSLAFWQFCSDFVKMEVLGLFREFFY